MAIRKTLKTYQGVPKTPIDDNTVFYASLDGTTVAEVGGSTGLLGTKYSPMPTGLGYNFNGAGDNSKVISLPDIQNEGTIDLMLDLVNMTILDTVSGNCLIDIYNAETSASYRNGIEVWITPAKALMLIVKNNVGSTVNTIPTISIPLATKHLRIGWKVGSRILNTYADGKLVASDSINAINTPLTSMLIGKYAGAGIYHKGALADISVSNIFRENYFPALPKDFIDGYAKISNAFNPQRNVYADPLTSQSIIEIVKARNDTRPLTQTVTHVAGEVWTSSDSIKIKGLSGEIIGGVIDADSALAKMIKDGDSGYLVYLDDVSKLAVNDTVKFYRPDNNTVTGDLTITAIDTVNKTITCGTNTFANIPSGTLVIETTTSSSSPVVKFSNAGVLTAVTGTWSGLGTSEATFTLGTNSALSSQDLQINYSLNILAGQGGISEVLTGVLGGEINAKTYEPSLFKGMTDFASKIDAYDFTNPNFMYEISTSTLTAPSAFIADGSYTGIRALLDGNISQLTASNGGASGDIPQQCFKFPLVDFIESQFGAIPFSSLADKVAWIKANVTNISCKWYGMGASRGTYKAYFAMWDAINSNWTGAVSSHSNDYTTLIARNTSTPSGYIDNYGNMNFLAYADSYDGVNACYIVSDYISLEITLKYSARYIFTSKIPPLMTSRKLTVNPSVHIRDDFANKELGNVLINPHKASGLASSTLVNPVGYAENFMTDHYNRINKLDGNLMNSSITTNGQMAQQVYAFNLIEIVERKFGEIKALDKVQWLKDNLNSVVINWTGYGSCPSGNMARLRIWADFAGVWAGTDASKYHTNPTSTVLTQYVNMLSTTWYNYIDANGYVYVLVYTDASNGTIASSIYTDYINIEVTLKTPTGYDVLVPENLRRDDGQSNLILVRKETKEIQTLFSANNEDGIYVMGQYAPFLGVATTEFLTATVPQQILAKLKFITTNGTGANKDSGVDKSFMTGAIKNYRNCYSKLFGSDNNYSYALTQEPLSTRSKYVSVPEYSYVAYPPMIYGASDNFFRGAYEDNQFVNTVYNFGQCLALVYKDNNGNLKLALLSANIVNGKYIKETYYLVDMANKPLVK